MTRYHYLSKYMRWDRNRVPKDNIGRESSSLNENPEDERCVCCDRHMPGIIFSFICISATGSALLKNKYALVIMALISARAATFIDGRIFLFSTLDELKLSGKIRSLAKNSFLNE